MLQNLVVKTLLICFSGFLLSLSAPGYDLWFIAWFGLIPLFIIINTSKKLYEILLYPFLFGFCYNFNYLHWFLSIHSIRLIGIEYFDSIQIPLLLLLILVIYYSLFFSIFALVTTCLRKLLSKFLNNGILNSLITAFIWLIVFNRFSAKEPILGGFPWTLVEYSQYKNLFLIQIAEYFGSMSISFLIVLFNLTLANMLTYLFNNDKDPKQFKIISLNLSFVLILILSSLVYGAYAFKNNQEIISDDSKEICILQGNLPKRPSRKRYTVGIEEAKKVFIQLGAKYNPSLFILPEGGLPVVYTHDLVTQNWVHAGAKLKQADIIAGTFCASGDRSTNCVLSYSLKTNQSTFYEKVKLVPVSERIPLRSILNSVFKKLGKNIYLREGFSIGKQNTPVITSFGKVGISICFELIFPDLIKNQSVQGAKLLINASSLKRFKNNLVKKQYLSFAVFRAIENRKPFILAVNNGISAFIAPNGKIQAQSLPEKRQALLHKVVPNDKVTFYAKYWW